MDCRWWGMVMYDIWVSCIPIQQQNYFGGCKSLDEVGEKSKNLGCMS